MLIEIFKKSFKYTFCKFCTIIGNRNSFRFLGQLIIAMQNSSRTYITYIQRPKYTTSIRTLSHSHSGLPQLAIVIQGPVITANEFTIETIKLYKQHFQNTFIILSTWNDIDESFVNLAKSLGVYVLINDKPNYVGTSNVNLQIVSAKAGVKKAKELGAEYVLKTRTDQRMYAPNVAQFLYDIINVFPLKSDIEKQNKRIVGLNSNTFKYRMYGLSDMLIYGQIDDMLLFWDIPLDLRVFSSDEIEKAGATLSSFAQSRICEVYLATEYLMRIGKKLSWTLEDSWNVFGDHFCIVDKESLGFYWGKYGVNENRWMDYSNTMNKFEEINFRDWLNFYRNEIHIVNEDKILDI